MVDVNSAFNGTKIDYKVLLLILCTVILFQIYLSFLDLESNIEISIIVISIIGQTSVGIAALFVAKKHGRSKFGVSFYSLAIAFFSLLVGEIIYNVYLFVFEIDPFPSISDIFFFLLYPFTMIHLIINVKFYQNQFNIKRLIGIVSFALAIILVYLFFAYDIYDELTLDFYYGLIFVAGAAFITSLGFYGGIVSRKIPLGRSWFLLVGGILLGTLADLWYQSLELVEAYKTDHIVNLFWYASYFVIIYSLYKYYKIM